MKHSPFPTVAMLTQWTNGRQVGRHPLMRWSPALLAICRMAGKGMEREQGDSEMRPNLAILHPIQLGVEGLI